MTGFKLRTFVVTVLTGDNKEHKSVFEYEASDLWGALIRHEKEQTFSCALAREIQVVEKEQVEPKWSSWNDPANP